VRSSSVDVILNLTAGMGAISCSAARRSRSGRCQGTDMAGATERLAHVEQCLTEICTLDCGSMNFAAGGDYVMVNTPDTLRVMAKRVQALGVSRSSRSSIPAISCWRRISSAKA